MEKYKCPKCKDALFTLGIDENGYEVSIPCECRAKYNTERQMIASGLSEQDLQVGFNDFKTLNEKGLTEAKNTAVNYYRNFKANRNTRYNSLLLSGESGRGKTMLGLATVNNIMSLSVSVLYAPYRETVTELKQNVVENKIKYLDKMERLKTSEVLFIDDLYKGKLMDADVSYIYEIVNYRYLNRLPMIISTECSCEKLLAIDEAVGGRIIEMSKGAIVEFGKDTKNYRLR